MSPEVPGRPAPPLLSLRGMGKRFGSLQALADVSLDIAPGGIPWRWGGNGGGRSTWGNLVFGVYPPDEGRMLLDGREYQPGGPADALSQRVAMVHQHFSLVPDLSVVDNLLLGQARGILRRRECAERIDELSRRYGLSLSPHARIQDLSVGERQRVEIVKCLMREPRVLVLDEPTAVLLPDEIASLLDVCQRVAAQGAGWVGGPHHGAESQQVATLAPGLTVRDADGVTRLDNFTLIVEPGEIVAVAGVEGNGQSELATVLSGMQPASEGRFFVKGQPLTGKAPRDITAAGVGIVPEDRHAVGCVVEMSVAENLFIDRLDRFKRFGLLNRQAMRTAALELMQRFDVRAASPDVAFGGLSGGNQQKAVLGRELTLDRLSFLMAAQPTRGLDVGAVEAVYGHIRAACDRGVGVLLISSELDELISVADRVVVIYRGRIMGECPAEPAHRDRIGAWMAGHAP